MAFFDKLTRLTKELTDNASLQLKLAEEKRKIPELYERLGQFVFTRFEQGEPTDEAYSKIINSILAVKESIGSIENEIETARNYVERKSTCPMCGAVNTNADVCVICGSEIPASAQETCEDECCCEDDCCCEDECCTDDKCCKDECCDQPKDCESKKDDCGCGCNSDK